MRTFTKVIFTCLVVLGAATQTNAQWVQEPIEPHPFYPVYFVASHGGKLYVAGNGGIASSSDNGASWTNLTTTYDWAGGGGNSNREIVFNGSTMYVRTTTQGVFRSLDGGATWSVDTVGLGPGRQVDMIFFDGTTVFCSINWPTAGFYKKTPAAGAWTKETAISTVSGMLQKGGKLYAFGAGNLYTSTDGGATWTMGASVGAPATNAGTGVHFVGTDIYSGGYRSTDDGVTWTSIGRTGTAYYSDGTNYYVGFGPISGGGDSVAMTSDGGATWTVTGGGGLNSQVQSITKHNGALYAAIWSRGQLIKSGVNTTAVSDIVSLAEMSIYPNPTKGTFSVEFGTEGNHDVKVTNVLGEVVYRNSFTGVSFSVDLNAQPAGLYMVYVSTPDGSRQTWMVTISN